MNRKIKMNSIDFDNLFINCNPPVVALTKVGKIPVFDISIYVPPLKWY